VDDHPPIRFDRFMERALYDPESGYYSRHVRAVGRRGDFGTVAALGPTLARTLSRWARPLFQKFRHHIEIGPGDGSLARDFWHASGWLTWTVRKHLVEVSSPLRARQQEVLRRGYIWHESMEEALRAAHGQAVIVSNEVPDAFPCRLLQWTGTGWLEAHVRIAPPAPPEEVWLPLEEPNLNPATFSSLRLAASYKPGQRIEIHDSFRTWLRGWAPFLHAGHVLWIDYGSTVDTLYHRRPHGSVRAYFQQQCLEGPEVYRRPGRQDLTADVNFTDLEEWGLELGWTTRFHGTQAEFIREFGPKLDSSEAHYAAHPHGMGGAFRVLWQEKT
jgi:SAM-dependent MidA family methyltransferase